MLRTAVPSLAERVALLPEERVLLLERVAEELPLERVAALPLLEALLPLLFRRLLFCCTDPLERVLLEELLLERVELLLPLLLVAVPLLFRRVLLFC